LANDPIPAQRYVAVSSDFYTREQKAMEMVARPKNHMEWQAAYLLRRPRPPRRLGFDAVLVRVIGQPETLPIEGVRPRPPFVGRRGIKAVFHRLPVRNRVEVWDQLRDALLLGGHVFCFRGAAGTLAGILNSVEKRSI
jgi:hypothetical protein